ncbi:FAD-dependent oxidoreductase [soil metagenome]
MESTHVLIAGAGPVGMTLAATLARFGIRSTIVEQNSTTTAHPKMDITNARSMEIFKALGLAEKLRAVAVPEDHCFDVSWVTQLNGEELARFAYPSVVEHRALNRAINDGSRPAESPMRVSQVEIEPVLRNHLEASPLVDVRFGVEFGSFAQDADGVTTTLRDRATGLVSQIRSTYLVGCDGGSSKVRSGLGIGLSGEARTMQRFMVHFRSPRRDLLMRWGRAWHYQSAFGTLIAQNDHDIWTLHARFPQGQKIETFDASELITQFVGEAIEHEVLVSNPWTPHLLVADSYGKGRVWLAGDAAHQYIPTGGYGMNTGVGDAFDLGWKLAAMVTGIGGAGLVRSYEEERRPVGLRNCAASRRHNDVRIRNAALYDAELFAQDEAGAEARRVAGEQIAARGNLENESWGIELGYAYGASSIVAHEADAEWVDDPLHYRPSTTPGVRLPNVILPDGSNVFDALGPWFTLLVTHGAEVGLLEKAATARGVPLKILHLGAPDLAPVYQAELVLVRPDHHVAWRGVSPNSASQAVAVFDLALGWLSPASSAAQPSIHGDSTTMLAFNSAE